jgi:two-component system, chemotaxis family, CheB/CheR fusion protein
MKNSPAARKKKPGLAEKKKENSFPYVAIGASAGGFEAVSELLSWLPADTGMSFIYIQHLSRDYKSMLTSLLARTTHMKVREAKDLMRMQPDHFYVIPPNKKMAVTDGKIKLSPRKKAPGANYAIDDFFCSLAEKHKKNVIGVLLSGTGYDGTKGLKAIKAAGGITFAQDKSSRFDGMPKSAIDEGVVDYILTPKEIARELVKFGKYSGENTTEHPTAKETDILNNNIDLKLIFRLLLKESGVDFNLYKMSTLKRRIVRRMLLHKIKSLKQYARLLMQNNEELTTLYQDLLINVTSFFRDAETFRYLRVNLLPALLKKKKSGEVFRVWIPACSSGEEAYSMAMLLLEMKENKGGNFQVQIFATDLSEKVIGKARSGEYTLKELDAVPAPLLKRYFTRVNGNYRVNKLLRDVCVFAPHNILRDPPFSRVDFISCRNLLIYLDQEAQKKVFSTFFYALNEGGVLMLGNSESIGSSQRLFSEINKKLRIYSRKKSLNVNVLPEIAPRFSKPEPEAENKLTVVKKEKAPMNFSNLDIAVDSVLLSNYTPPSVVINHEMEILQFRGSTSLFLQHSPGKATLNILKMARPEISFELRNVIDRAIKQKKTIQKSGVELKSGSTLRILTIEVTPLNLEWHEPLLMVLFHEESKEEISASRVKEEKGSFTAEKKIARLQEEIAAYRHELRSITENHEAAIEELQSANEEIVSGNEELQTVNEELQTSKEEIQSTNEELATVNQELQTRNDLLAEANRYSEAIIHTLHESIVVLDKNLKVKTANDAFYKQFKFKPHNTEGVPIYRLGNFQLKIPRLRELLEGMIVKGGKLRDIEIRGSFKGVGEKVIRVNASVIEKKNLGEQLILLAISDITEAVHKREEIERMHYQHDKALEIKNRDLDEKNRELEKMNKELESFSFVSSHDLQEPLRKIRNFITCLQEEELPNLSEQGQHYLQRIQLTTRRMQTLIEDLLVYSKITNDRIQLKPVELSKVVAKVKDNFKEVLEEKGGTIKSGELCLVKAVPFQLQQLMDNLVGNALKFSDKKRKPRIQIFCKLVKGSKTEMKELYPDKNYFRITVKDNGIGFDSKYKDRIFEVFQRLHEFEEYKGTGIGLAICRKIALNHNGAISANGKLGKGARFDIFIPA